MDALPMPESNESLAYRTKTDHAHMCWHDGHMAIVLTVAQVLNWNSKNFGEDQLIRLLFQPAEEESGGSLTMIKEGCLEDIDEVYALHNIPNFDEGDIRICEGPILAGFTLIKIIIKGKGGHNQTPSDPIDAATALQVALASIVSCNIDSQ